MRQHIVRSAMTMGFGVMVCLVAPFGAPVTSAGTQVNINVNIGAPPPVVVRSAPTMVYLAEPAAYVAVGIPYDIFFVSGRYYYARGNDWFWAAGYGGPWVVVSSRSLPPGLQRYKVERLREFREREYKVYKVQGPAFKGKHFEAEEHEKGHGNSDNNGRGNSGNSKKGK